MMDGLIVLVCTYAGFMLGWATCARTQGSRVKDAETIHQLTIETARLLSSSSDEVEEARRANRELAAAMENQRGVLDNLIDTLVEFQTSQRTIMSTLDRAGLTEPGTVVSQPGRGRMRGEVDRGNLPPELERPEAMPLQGILR